MQAHLHNNELHPTNAWLSAIKNLGSVMDLVYARSSGEIWLFDNDLKVVGDRTGAFEVLYKERIDGSLAEQVKCIKFLLRTEHYDAFLKGHTYQNLRSLSSHCIKKIYVGKLDDVKPKPPSQFGGANPWVFYLGEDKLLSPDGVVIVRPRSYPFTPGKHDIHDPVAVAWHIDSNPTLRSRLSAAGWFERVFYKEVAKWFKSLEPETEIDQNGKEHVKTISICEPRSEDDIRALSVGSRNLSTMRPIMPPIDCAIVTALPVELDAVRQVFGLTTKSVDDSEYFLGRVPTPTGILTVAAAVCSRPGSVEAALVTSKLMRVWKPKNVFLLGICAARPNSDGADPLQSRLKGDIIVATTVCPYEYIAVTESDEGIGASPPEGEGHRSEFPESNDLQCSGPFADRAFRIADKWKKPLTAIFPNGEKCGRDYRKAHKGGLGSGSKLSRDAGWFEKMRQIWHRKLEGIEMEAEGVGKAVRHANQPFNFLVIKGIVDYGDMRKDDTWHSAASKAGALFLLDVLKATDPLTETIHRPRTTYLLPCRPRAVYVNVTDACLNNCNFCIKRDGPTFFGQNLSLSGGRPSSAEILAAIVGTPGWPAVEEVVFCGMGEPLLRYDCVLDVCRKIKSMTDVKAKTRVDTSGLHWGNEKRLDLLDYVDILSVSLNAETPEKYKELCQPKIPNAYAVLMDFLRAVKRHEDERRAQGHPFPEVRLSVVDTTEEACVPASGRQGYAQGAFPVPDFAACERITASFGWRFIVKRLFRDTRDAQWNEDLVEAVCLRGETPEACRSCSFRH